MPFLFFSHSISQKWFMLALNTTNLVTAVPVFICILYGLRSFDINKPAHLKLFSEVPSKKNIIKVIILKDVRCRCRHTFFVSRAETQFFNSILCGLKEIDVIYFRCSLSQRLKCKNSAIFFAIIPSVAINLCVHKLLYVLGANDFSDFSNCGFIPICIFFPILIFA